MNAPTPFADLNTVLHELVTGVQQVLGATVVAAYLQGSFAVGDFDRDSDVDFIVVIANELSSAQVAALQTLHARIYALESYWAQHLEGSYFPQGTLKQSEQLGQPLWYLDNGSRTLIQDKHDDTLVVRWVLREMGIPLAGPDPATLVDPISTEGLRQEIWATMNGWGQEILAKPEIISNRFYQTFAVLNYCRMLHDLHTGRVGSKRAGAEWAKVTLDPSWAGLIDRAWAGRPVPEVSVRTPADPADLESTLKFLQYVLDLGRVEAARP